MGRVRAAFWILPTFLLGVAGSVRPVRADVYLNELTVRPVGASDLVELYNRGPGAIDLSGWTILADKGSFTIPPGTVIPPGIYSVFDAGDIMLERGGVTSLIDILQGPEGERTTVRDAVAYGQAGSAPLPPAGMSLARAPDAATAVPTPPNPALDGLVWTIDPTPTFGAMNDAPVPQFGENVALNEVDPALDGGGDRFELFNPAMVPVPVNGWVLINGDAMLPLNGLMPPGGFLAWLTPPEFDLEIEELLYLFDESGVRVDQLGFHAAPALPAGSTLQRCPDGAAPHLGYDYVTSGGGTTFLVLPQTLGFSNCSPLTVPEPVTRQARWGRLKATLGAARP